MNTDYQAFECEVARGQDLIDSDLSSDPFYEPFVTYVISPIFCLVPLFRSIQGCGGPEVLNLNRTAIIKNNEPFGNYNARLRLLLIIQANVQ